MEKTFKIKKGEDVYDKIRKEQIINYIIKILLKNGNNLLKPRFKKDIKLTINIE